MAQMKRCPLSYITHDVWPSHRKGYMRDEILIMPHFKKENLCNKDMHLAVWLHTACSNSCTQESLQHKDPSSSELCVSTSFPQEKGSQSCNIWIPTSTSTSKLHHTWCLTQFLERILKRGKTDHSPSQKMKIKAMKIAQEALGYLVSATCCRQWLRRAHILAAGPLNRTCPERSHFFPPLRIRHSSSGKEFTVLKHLDCHAILRQPISDPSWGASMTAVKPTGRVWVKGGLPRFWRKMREAKTMPSLLQHGLLCCVPEAREDRNIPWSWSIKTASGWWLQRPC